MLTLFDKACAAEQDKVDEGQENSGKYQLLVGHIYWPFGFVFTLSDIVRILLAVGEHFHNAVSTPRTPNSNPSMYVANKLNTSKHEGCEDIT